MFSCVGTSRPSDGFLVGNFRARYPPLLPLGEYILFLVGEGLCFCFLKLAFVYQNQEGRLALGRSTEAKNYKERNMFGILLCWMSG